MKIMFWRKKKRNNTERLPESIETIIGCQQSIEQVLESNAIAGIKDPVQRAIRFLWDEQLKALCPVDLVSSLAEDKKWNNLKDKLNKARLSVNQSINEKIDAFLLCSYIINSNLLVAGFIESMGSLSSHPLCQLLTTSHILRIHTHNSFIEPTMNTLLVDIENEINLIRIGGE